MKVQFQVAEVQRHDDGTATVWLRWLINNPGTGYFPRFPAKCPHQDVAVGDWWELELQSVSVPQKGHPR